MQAEAAEWRLDALAADLVRLRPYRATYAPAITSRPNAASRTANSAARSRGQRSEPEVTPYQ
jgi:hypothetical protein